MIFDNISIDDIALSIGTKTHQYFINNSINTMA